MMRNSRQTEKKISFDTLPVLLRSPETALADY
jgi:hypothetical protein